MLYQHYEVVEKLLDGMAATSKKAIKKQEREALITQLDDLPNRVTKFGLEKSCGASPTMSAIASKIAVGIFTGDADHVTFGELIKHLAFGRITRQTQFTSPRTQELDGFSKPRV
uniref:Uncharacterized protein n=1 Tax=Solanum tuberosum TaxID=4113 RepID=M1DMV6_SOLTU